MRACDISHSDRRRRARAASVRSGSERDGHTRAVERSLSPGERLRIGFELSRFAARLHPDSR